MNAQVVSFKCIVKNMVGTMISSSVNYEVLTSAAGPGDMLGGLAEALQSLKKGEKRSVSLSAKDAYGFYDPAKVILMPRKKILTAAQLKSGQSVSIVMKSGATRVFRVVQIFGDMIQLDGNHPLAGQDLVFEIEALAVREATPEEMGDGHNVISEQVLH